MLNTYTSTGNKLIHHPVVVSKLKWERKARPISLQIGPTSRCNLNCVFCSNANRETHEDLEPGPLKRVIKELRFIGLKTVEWTGGGDPTLYEHINFMLSFCDAIGLEQGFISNGILLKEKIEEPNLNRLKWLRISMNSLDYVEKVDVPEIRGTLGFSYVMNDKTTPEVLSKLDYHVGKYKPEYVRIVTNCLATDEEQKHNNWEYGKMVEDWGKPYFYQPKEFERSEKCYWNYFKPFVLHDGYVYPCSSVVLNSEASGKFHSKYRWIRMTELPNVYKNQVKPFPTVNCNHCVFKGQNDLIDMVLNPEMENFV
jgi:MoaA/NifB/PqqE/SkfB family radical SAM enzyme